jgi:hypothetical protein
VTIVVLAPGQLLAVRLGCGAFEWFTAALSGRFVSNPFTGWAIKKRLYEVED